jgi:phosphoribosylanthranilate isomerase
MRAIELKICGITNVADAAACIESGANYLGLVFVTSSPRCVELKAAHEICAAAKGRIKTVGVFQDAPVDQMQSIRQQLGLDFIQLHGNETADICNAVAPSIKAVVLNAELNLSALKDYGEQLIIFDKPKSGGQTSLSAEEFSAKITMSEYVPARFFFAGSLSEKNISDTIHQLKNLPGFAGIDIASGIESSPGIKDHEKLKLFCQRAKEAMYDAAR